MRFWGSAVIDLTLFGGGLWKDFGAVGIHSANNLLDTSPLGDGDQNSFIYQPINATHVQKDIPYHFGTLGWKCHWVFIEFSEFCRSLEDKYFERNENNWGLASEVSEGHLRGPYRLLLVWDVWYFELRTTNMKPLLCWKNWLCSAKAEV